jgi:hypothetical protein
MKKRLAITLLILCIAVVAGFTVYLLGTLTTPGASSVIPHYLVYDGKPSKIYLVDAVTSYSNANETYATPDGQVVEKGTPLFVIRMTLRNDYTSDHPAQPLHNQDQTSPADGTAYLYLTAQLYGKDGQLNATNVSVSDFSLPAVPGTGLVLSNGETAPVNIYMATSQTNINKYEVNLYFLGDSIPSRNT